jgi:hypothetical protein
MNENHFEKIIKNINHLLLPFKKYNHWKKYGLEMTSRQTNKKAEIIVSRSTIEFKPASSPNRFTIFFKQQIIKKNNSILTHSECNQFSANFISFLNSTQPNPKPFIIKEED